MEAAAGGRTQGRAGQQLPHPSHAAQQAGMRACMRRPLPSQHLQHASPLGQLAPRVHVVPVIKQHIDASMGAVQRIPRIVVDQHMRPDAPEGRRQGGQRFDCGAYLKVNLNAPLPAHARWWPSWQAARACACGVVGWPPATYQATPAPHTWHTGCTHPGPSLPAERTCRFRSSCGWCPTAQSGCQNRSP